MKKLTESQVIDARREYALGRMHLTEFRKRTVEKLAAKHKVAITTMYDALHYRTYVDVDEALHEVPELVDWSEDNMDERWKG